MSGLTPGVLRGPRFRRLFKGVYISTDTTPTPRLQAEAALALQPDRAYASHFSAARLLGLPVPTHPDEHVTVIEPDDRRRRRGITCHVAPKDAAVIPKRGLRVSPPGQLFVELASMLTLVDLVIRGDAIVRKGWLTPEALIAACRASGDRYAAAALAAAKYVRDGVDSPLETRLRLLIVLAGLPEPRVNFKLLDELGNVLRRLDLSYPHLKLIVEYDGRQHADDPDQYDWDIDRREELDIRKWRIVVVTSKGIYQNPEQTLIRVRRALEDCGAVDLPVRRSDAWRPHFPGYQGIMRLS